MTSLLLMLLSREDSANAVLTRYANAMHAMPSFEVHVTTKTTGKQDINADMIVDSTKRFMYHGLGKNIDWKVTISPAGYREVSIFEKTYDEYPYNGTTKIFDSRISGVWKAIPLWIHAARLEQFLPPGSKFSYAGKETVAGKLCDHLHTTFSGAMGNGTGDAFIGPDGLIYRYHAHVASQMEGLIDTSWDFSDYKPVKSFSADKFANYIPDGFMPFSLAFSDGPIPVGFKPAMRGWIDSKTGKPWAVPVGKPVLILLAGHESMPSEKAVAELKTWRNSLNEKGVTVAMASDATTPSDSRGLLFDPKQSSLKSLNPPATPMFYLLDRSGKVANLWMGFDQNAAGKLRGDINKAIASLKAK